MSRQPDQPEYEDDHIDVAENVIMISPHLLELWMVTMGLMSKSKDIPKELRDIMEKQSGQMDSCLTYGNDTQVLFEEDD